VTTSVAYTAVLDVRRETVLFVSQLLHTDRRRRGTRAGTRALGCFAQAVLVLRWFLDGTRLAQLARDNTIAGSTVTAIFTKASPRWPNASRPCTRRCWQPRWPGTATSTSTAP
jgi:hypothetical protein